VDYDITIMSSAPKCECECEVLASNLKLKIFFMSERHKM